MQPQYVDSVLKIYRKAGYNYKPYFKKSYNDHGYVVSPFITRPDLNEDILEETYQNIKEAKPRIAEYLCNTYPKVMSAQTASSSNILTKLIVEYNNNKLEHDINEFLQTTPISRLIDIKLQYVGTGSMALIIYEV